MVKICEKRSNIREFSEINFDNTDESSIFQQINNEIELKIDDDFQNQAGIIEHQYTSRVKCFKLDLFSLKHFTLNVYWPF